MVGAIGGPDKMLFTGHTVVDPEVDGKTMAQLMSEWNKDLFETGLELERRSAENGLICCIGFAMDPANLRRVLRHPRVMIGTDAALVEFEKCATHPPRVRVVPAGCWVSWCARRD